MGYDEWMIRIDRELIFRPGRVGKALDDLVKS